MATEPGAQAEASSPQVSRADRERVIDLLKVAFVEGRLTRDEFGTRVGRALESRTYAELAAVSSDLPVELLEARMPRPATRTPGRVSMNTAITAGAFVILVANGGMLAALLLGSGVAVAVMAAFTVIGAIVAITAMIVAP